MPIVRLYKVGRSIVLTVPRAVREQAKLVCGDSVLVESVGNEIRVRAMEVRKVPPSPASATDQDLRRMFQRGDE